MRRREFLAFLGAAPLAALGLSQKPAWMKRHITGGHYDIGIMDDVLDNHCGSASAPKFEEIWKIIDLMKAQGKMAGSSFNFLKSREAGKIMARVDRDHIKKFGA